MKLASNLIIERTSRFGNGHRAVNPGGGDLSRRAMELQVLTLMMPALQIPKMLGRSAFENLVLLLVVLSTALHPLSASARVSHSHGTGDLHTHNVAIHQLDEHATWHQHGENETVPSAANADSIELSTESGGRCEVTISALNAVSGHGIPLPLIHQYKLLALAPDAPSEGLPPDLGTRARALQQPCTCVDSLLRSSHAFLL